MSLNELSKQIYLQNKQKGFWDKEVNIGEKLMLIVTELSEALESNRGRKKELNREIFEKTLINENYYENIENKNLVFKNAFEAYVKDSFEDEMADAIIRMFDLCGGLNIDIDWHIEQKLKYNSTREYKHGKKY